MGNQTVVFEKENDPSILMASSPGKLIKYLVEDGGHVHSGDPYCEIEVMKMVTTLHGKFGLVNPGPGGTRIHYVRFSQFY